MGHSSPCHTAASILSQPALCSRVRGVLQGMQQSMCSSLRFIYTYMHAGAVPACPVLAVLPVWWRTAFLRDQHCAKAAFLSVSGILPLGSARGHLGEDRGCLSLHMRWMTSSEVLTRCLSSAKLKAAHARNAG